VRIALPGLIADTTLDPELHARMFERLAGRLAAATSPCAEPSGGPAPIGSDCDLPELAEAIAGIAMFRLLARPGAMLDDRWVDGLADMLVNGWQPPKPGSV
jgi:hypothetical protein